MSSVPRSVDSTQVPAVDERAVSRAQVAMSAAAWRRRYPFEIQPRAPDRTAGTRPVGNNRNQRRDVHRPLRGQPRCAAVRGEALSVEFELCGSRGAALPEGTG
jgi:hypothetical protein